MSSIENLKEAFAGESQANRKYLAFAQKAEQDNMPNIAKLFRAAAEAETVHAHAHLRALDGVKSTVENVEAAIDGEGFEFQNMYPKFLEEAKKDGHKKAEISFNYALQVEEIHHDLYSKALESAKAGKDIDAGTIYVCQVCGNTIIGDHPDKCPVCSALNKWTAIN